jgi:CBS-domain-containing membrane protein
MFGLLACLEDDRIGPYLIPPFGAALTTLLDLPEAPVAQTYALIAGFVAGASVGTLLGLFSHGSVMAILAAIAAFGIIKPDPCLPSAWSGPCHVSLAASSGPLVSSDHSSPFHRGCSRTGGTSKQASERMACLSTDQR